MSSEKPHLLRWILVLPSALVGFLAGQVAFMGMRWLVAHYPSMSWLSYSGWLFSDCLASALFIILGTRIAPSHKFATALWLSAIVATWHGVLLGANPFHPVSDSHSELIVAITCITGLIISAVLCWDAYKSERDWKGSELKTYLPELSEEMPEPGTLIAWEPEITMVPSQMTYKPVETADRVFFASDLVLLERELLKIEPCTDSYISALKLGIAIERDEGYINLEGECFSFSQLMRDLSMRLSVREPDQKLWVDLANVFWQYANQDMDERRKSLERVLLILPAARETATAQSIN